MGIYFVGGQAFDDGSESGYSGPVDPHTWQPVQPAPAKTPLQEGFDTNPYLSYLQYAAKSGDVAGASVNLGNPEGGFSDIQASQDFLSNPASLFDASYNAGSRRSVNPYFDPRIRDAIRGLAGKLGLTPQDADRAALAYAQRHYDTVGQGYSEAIAPANIANEIASQLFQQAGKPYQGLTAEQIAGFDQQAGELQG